MAAQTVDEVETIALPQDVGDGIVVAKEGMWWAIWRDHANRIMKFKLGDGLEERQAKIIAFETVERYVADVAIRNRVVDMLDHDDVVELGHRADFPREVVARCIDEICRRLAREGSLPISDKTPAIHLFVERTRNVDGKGMSARDVNRILGEEDRITVSSSVIDLICVEFDINYSDVVESALEWSRLDGRWSDRVGERDPWPYGYKLQSASVEDDIL